MFAEWHLNDPGDSLVYSLDDGQHRRNRGTTDYEGRDARPVVSLDEPVSQHDRKAGPGQKGI